VDGRGAERLHRRAQAGAPRGEAGCASAAPIEGTWTAARRGAREPERLSHDLSGEQVVFALYGDDTLVFTVWTGEGPPPPDFPDPPEYKRVVGRNGQIRVVGQYISAVVMLHRRKSDFDFRDEADVPEDECWVEVIPAISEEAVPLPDRLVLQRPK
jgi:hypothetical protein